MKKDYNFFRNKICLLLSCFQLSVAGPAFSNPETIVNNPRQAQSSFSPNQSDAGSGFSTATQNNNELISLESSSPLSLPAPQLSNASNEALFVSTFSIPRSAAEGGQDVNVIDWNHDGAVSYHI